MPGLFDNPIGGRKGSPSAKARNSAAVGSIIGGRKGSPSKKYTYSDLNPQAKNALAQAKKLSNQQLQDLLTTPGANNQPYLSNQGVDLNPQALNALASQAKVGKAGSAPVGGSSSASGGSSAAADIPAFDWTWGIPDYKPFNYENPYDKPYDKLIAAAKATGASDLEAMQAIRDKIGGNYDNAEKGIYDQYQGSRSSLDAEAASLGAQGGNYYDDKTLRQIQETNDQGRAQDQSYFDKLKATRTSELDNLYVGLSNEKVQQMAMWQIAQAERDAAAQQAVIDQRQTVADSMAAAASSSGGGSGHRSGGSGSSSSSGKLTTTETATQKDVVDDPNFLASIEGMNPEDRALAIAIHTGNSNNQDAASFQALADTASKQVATPFSGEVTQQEQGLNAQARNASNKNNAKYATYINAQRKAKADRDRALRLRQAAYKVGGIFGIPSSTQTVTTTGKTSQKTPYIP